MLHALVLAAQILAAPHWPPGARVAVWVDVNHAPAGASDLVDRALKHWSDAARGQLTLVRASSRAEAGIRVFFSAGDGIYGEAAPRVNPQTGFIAQADIVINSALPDDPFDARIVLYLTALHELGHALGLPHSDAFGAIMYRFRRADDGERFFGAYRRKLRSADDVGAATASGLDAEDVATLKNLYR